ncbi:MAG TPA: hypothetical protein VGE74_03880, partial [Gemmata sp.]
SSQKWCEKGYRHEKSDLRSDQQRRIRVRVGLSRPVEPDAGHLMSEETSWDRHRVVVLFGLAGAALGVLSAMLAFTTGSDGYGRTDIAESVPLVLATTVFGCFAGATFSHAQRTKRAIAAGVLLLTVLIGAAMGWLVGDALTRGAAALETASPSPGRSTLVGGSAGLLFGLLVLLSQRIGARRS